MLFQITGGPSATSDSPTVAYYTGSRVQIGWGNTTYSVSSIFTGVSLYDPARDKRGSENGNQTLSTGDWVVAMYDPDTQRFVILQGSYFKFRRVQLTSNMSSGSCNAKVLAWNGSAYATTGSDFTVYDSQSAFPTAISGLNGFAIYEPDRAVWELVFVPSGQSFIGILNGTLAYGSSATATIYTGTPGSETGAYTKTVYPWMMNTGDSIPANTEVAIFTVNGRLYALNAACKNIYGS